MQVSIILVNYNTKQLLLQCIQSVYHHTTGINYEVIIVDNASSDDSIPAVKAAFPKVTCIENSKNVGFGVANNIGVEKAVGKYIFFLNSDTILLNNAIKVFYDFMEDTANVNVGAVGGELLNNDGAIIHSYSNFPSLLQTLSITFRHNVYYKTGLIKLRRLISKPIINYTPVKEAFKVDYITGADLFMRKDVFTKAGGFNPDFFMYFEESDLQKRLSNMGLSRMIIPGTKIIHLEGASSTGSARRSKKNDYFYSSMHTYFKLHKTRVSYTFFRILFSLMPPIPM